MDLQEQIKAYTVWVNSQLKKRSLKIRDLKTDLTDGTVLVSVVEIVSGCELKSIKSPKNDAERRMNMESVLTFMKGQKINLNHVSIEDLLVGNVKTLMQLILALAAHFKPASISEKSSALQHNRQSNTLHKEKRPKKLINENLVSNNQDINHKKTDLQQEMGKEIENIKTLAQNLQKILLDEMEDMPLNNLNEIEDTLLLNAKLNQAETEKLSLEKEVFELKHECRKLHASCNAAEVRMKNQQDEILNLRQAVMQGNLERDRLQSDKAEYLIQIADAEKDCDKYRQRYKEYELLYRQLKDNSVASSSPISHLYQKEPALRTLESPTSFHSTLLSTSPNNRLGKKISRRSPVTRGRGSARKKDPENEVTRILYFADKEMTPAMATISSRVGDITLGDFKKAVKRERGKYRFVFKALDPELGTVKEEIFHNDDIIPGWEGKIVAWVEQA